MSENKKLNWNEVIVALLTKGFYLLAAPTFVWGAVNQFGYTVRWAPCLCAVFAVWFVVIVARWQS